MADIGSSEQAHQDFKFIPPKDGHDHVVPSQETIVPERSGVSRIPDEKRTIVPPNPPVPDMAPQTPEQSFWQKVRRGRFH